MKHGLKWAVLAAAVVSAGALGLAGTARAAEELKIGGIGSLSGGGTAWGLAIQRGAEIAIDEVNAQGGLKVGGKTYTVRLIMYDDAYSGQGGTTAATRLVTEDKVRFIVGPIGSAPVLGTVAVTTPAQVLLMSDGYAPAILKNDARSPYNFRVTNTTNEFMPAAVKWMRAHFPDKQRVGILSTNDATGQAVLPLMKMYYEEAGFKVAFQEYFERGTKEFTPLLTRMLASGIDIYELDGNSPGDAALLVKQIRQLGFTGPVIQIGGPSIEEIMAVAGPLAEGFLSYDMFDFAAAASQRFIQAYRKKYGEGIINAQTPAFYNGTKVLLEAIRRAGSLDTTRVRDTLEKKMEGYDAGLYGPLVWGGMKNYGVNHQMLLPFYITEVRGDKTQPLIQLKPIKQ
jgi:branched-chain amino acid transport system substrate-binding protein